ncbi:MAG: cysteine peptidase family C39 domain-containing protein [Candidatus Hydrogenedentales bacterium]|jgi:hypothetical protein
MHVNPLILPTLILAFGLFFVAYRIAPRIETATARTAWYVFALLSPVPALLMALFYLHLYDDSVSFYAFRAFPYSELSASGAGVAAGTLAYWVNRVRVAGFFFIPGVLLLMVLGIAAPYAKPMLAPVDPSVYRNTWRDGVCIQSTASCGAASVATILKHFGIDATEKEIALECYTYVAGTENWYLARALRRRGLKVTFCIDPPLPEVLPVPCIAGVNMGAAGHFITILEQNGDSYVVGDPLVGRATYSKEDLFREFRFTGFFMAVKEGV